MCFEVFFRDKVTLGGTTANYVNDLYRLMFLSNFVRYHLPRVDVKGFRLPTDLANGHENDESETCRVACNFSVKS